MGYPAKIRLHFEEVRIRIADAVLEENTTLLNNFHPTKDRLNSFWLKLFLGNDVSDIVKQGSYI